jgi:hypothetical protein
VTREGSRTLVADIALAARKETEDCNAAEFFRAVMKEEPRTASRYVRVARFASPRDEQAYGVNKLDAALGFIEAKLGNRMGTRGSSACSAYQLAASSRSRAAEARTSYFKPTDGAGCASRAAEP